MNVQWIPVALKEPIVLSSGERFIWWIAFEWGLKIATPSLGSVPLNAYRQTGDKHTTLSMPFITDLKTKFIYNDF